MNPQEEFAKFLAETSFEFPEGYNDVVTLGLTNIKPWYFISREEIPSAFIDVNAMYSAQTVVPFARRQDNDDYACFLIKEGEYFVDFGQVVIIHLWADPGYERRNEYVDFWAWFRDAIETMIWFHTPYDYGEGEKDESYESYNLPTAHIAAIAEGLADEAAGRYRDGNQVFQEMRARLTGKVQTNQQAEAPALARNLGDSA